MSLMMILQDNMEAKKNEIETARIEAMKKSSSRLLNKIAEMVEKKKTKLNASQNKEE